MLSVRTVLSFYILQLRSPVPWTGKPRVKIVCRDTLLCDPSPYTNFLRGKIQESIFPPPPNLHSCSPGPQGTFIRHFRLSRTPEWSLIVGVGLDRFCRPLAHTPRVCSRRESNTCYHHHPERYPLSPCAINSCTHDPEMYNIPFHR